MAVLLAEKKQFLTVTHINFNLYHYTGNNPVRYIDPDGRQSFSPFSFSSNPIADFWALIFNHSSGGDKIASGTIAALNGDETCRNAINNLSPYMSEIMGNIAKSVTIESMEFVRDYGGIFAVAAYSSGNVILGMTIDGITCACDITLSWNEYKNSKQTDADLTKFVTSVSVTAVTTLAGLYAGNVVSSELERACVSPEIADQISNAVGDIVSNFAATTYKVLDETINQ